jgi:excisionase family DNA binding protein
MSMSQELLTTSEVARVIGVSVGYLQSHRKNLEIPIAFKQGRELRFYADEITGWLVEHRGRADNDE